MTSESRKIDSEVAEKVMGWTLYKPRGGVSDYFISKDRRLNGKIHRGVRKDGFLHWVPLFATSWYGFSLLVERMRELGFTFDIDSTVTASTDFTWHHEDWEKVWRVTGNGEAIPKLAACASILAASDVNHHATKGPGGNNG